MDKDSDPPSPPSTGSIRATKNRSRSKKKRGGKRKKPKVSITDFTIYQKIGEGGFGTVFLAVHNPTQRILALKRMSKTLIEGDNKVEHVKNERRILIEGNSTYLLGLNYAFQDPDYLYLCTEYCPGGDLDRLLSTLERLQENEAKMYIAEMIMGVHTLHQLGYIHRDLKPENFLIDEKGHLKLADFGLSKAGQLDTISLNYDLTEEQRQELESIKEGEKSDDIVVSGILEMERRKSRSLPISTTYQSNEIKLAELAALRGTKERSSLLPMNKQKKTFLAYSVVGSPYYMSPEVTDIPLKNKENVQGYGEEVDWWSLGCVFFELIIGTPAFGGETRREIWVKINNWEEEIPKLFDEIRDYLSPEFINLLERLLCKPENRLGRDIEEIKNHPYFRGVDWDNLREMTPIWVPSSPKLEDL